MNKHIYIGIDGGGTGSRGLAVNAEGDSLAKAEGDALNPYTLPPEQVSVNLQHLLAALTKMADVQQTQIRGICAGLSGVRTPKEEAEVHALLRRHCPEATHIRITHDLDVALRGGTSEGKGVVVVAGTGAAAYGRWGDHTALSGGWGQMMGDEGGGYWLGMQALRAIARSEDGRGEPTALREKVFTHLGIDHPRDLVTWSLQASKAEVAALAKHVLTCAQKSDPPSQQIAANGARQITRMISTVVHRLRIEADTFEIALTGGLTAEETGYFDLCRDCVLNEQPDATVIRPHHTPAWGAAQMAI